MLRDSACIAGIGETSYVRRSDLPVQELILAAARDAIADAGLRSGDIDGIATEGYLTPHLFDHDALAANLGVGDHFSATSGRFGAGIGGAILAAVEAISAGLATTVLCYFGVDWGTHSDGAYAATDRRLSPKAALELPYGFYGQPMYFAQMATRYRWTYGVDLEGLLGPIAIQLRRHAQLCGSAQMTRPLDAASYRAAPLVAEPLRGPDCCLLTDGAAALVLTTPEIARSRPQRPVFFKGGCFRAAPIPMDAFFSQNPEFLTWPAARGATDEALHQAGIERGDLDFLELYDCFTITLVTQLESLGFCGPGEAGALIGDGSGIGITGRLPVNTHGGLLSHDYVLGMSHLVESTRQLRGTAGATQVPDASLGLVGLLTAGDYCTIILGRDGG